MKEKTKNILILFGIYCIASFVAGMLILLPLSDNYTLPNIAQGFLISLFVPICWLLFWIIVFSPALVALYFLFKKFKGTKARIFLVAFLIPFLNMIYYLIEYFAYYGNEAFLSMCIGFYSIVFFLPILLLATLSVPKSLFPFKIETIKTLSLMFLLG